MSNLIGLNYGTFIIFKIFFIVGTFIIRSDFDFSFCKLILMMCIKKTEDTFESLIKNLD